MLQNLTKFLVLSSFTSLRCDSVLHITVGKWHFVLVTINQLIITQVVSYGVSDLKIKDTAYQGRWEQTFQLICDEYSSQINWNVCPHRPWDWLDIQKLDIKGVYRLFQNSQRWSFKKNCGNLFENYQKINKSWYLSKTSFHYWKAEIDVQQLHRSSAQMQGNDECLEHHHSA